MKNNQKLLDNYKKDFDEEYDEKRNDNMHTCASCKITFCQICTHIKAKTYNFVKTKNEKKICCVPCVTEFGKSKKYDKTVHTYIATIYDAIDD